MTPSASDRLFNTPVEAALRSLFLLEAVQPEACDVSRLVIYDYLLVHSADAPVGPASLHPATPMRSGELLVRRRLVESGLRLPIGKALATKSFTEAGIVYAAGSLATPFLDYLQSEYARRCRQISGWIADRFQQLTDAELREFVQQNIGRWGAEFHEESVLWEDVE